MMKWVILAFLLAMPPSVSAQRAESGKPTILSPVPIPLVYQLRWLDEVAPFVTEAEREARPPDLPLFGNVRLSLA